MNLDKDKAIDILASRLAGTFDIDIGDKSKLVYSVTKAPKHETVYFIKLNKDHPAARLCPLTHHSSRTHSTGRSNRSYTVTTATRCVVCICFSSKCRLRQGNCGKPGLWK
jgi:hypothetical protein